LDNYFTFDCSFQMICFLLTYVMTLLPPQAADKMSAMTIEAQTTPQKHAAMTPRVTALLDSVGGGCGVVGGVVTAAQIIA
jgi:hypothetical protein